MVNFTETENSPLVSVIMPAYNAESYIEQAVRSVIGQTIKDWELIVLDDGSQDGTCAIVESLAREDDRIRFVRNVENIGVAKTRNRGFEICSGQYVALLDSDDVWHPEKLEMQLARMEQTGAELSYTSYAIVDREGRKTKADYLVPEIVSLKQLLKQNVIGCSTVMLTARLAKRNPFRTEYYHEDYVLWLQLLRSGCRVAGCTQVLVDWRYAEDSRSFNKLEAAKNRWQIYREYLGLSLPNSLWLLANYGAASLKKYLKSPKKTTETVQ